MNLFIDTNIYLSYFGYDSKLDSLKSLKKVLKSKSIKLLITDQLINELDRNTGNRIFAEYEKLDQKFDFPIFKLHETKSAKEFNEKINEAKKFLNDYKKEIEKKFNIHTHEVKQLIKELFTEAVLFQTDDSIIKKANIRHIKGNPPKKKNDNSYGDAINWELFLKNVKAEDLSIVSDDVDYAENSRDGKIINLFLKKEWQIITKKSVRLFKTLGEFLVEQDRPIRDSVIKNEYEALLKNYDLLNKNLDPLKDLLKTNLFSSTSQAQNFFSTNPWLKYNDSLVKFIDLSDNENKN